MKSKWKVTTNVVDGGRRVYGVYRTLDTSKVDHSGNREFCGGYHNSKADADKIAEELNQKEGQRNND